MLRAYSRNTLSFSTGGWSPSGKQVNNVLKKLVPKFHILKETLCQRHYIRFSNTTDPFDEVLRKIGLSQIIQDVSLIESTPNRQEDKYLHAPCRVHVGGRPVAQVPNIPGDIRDSWARKCIKFIHPTPQTATHIRPISLNLNLNGTVQPDPVHGVPARDRTATYSSRHRIPPSTISNLSLQERVWRAEKFALGTLLYEISTGHNPFPRVSDNDVQDLYREGVFPADMQDLMLPIQVLIYACWSGEFGLHFSRNNFSRYVHDNPGRFALQCTGAVIGSAALITVPVLGAIGFSAMGPVGGSVAAGWQASIGLVEVGSLFAFCQSAAMGGATASGLFATGIAGIGVAAAATPLSPSHQNDAAALRKMFIQRFRK